MASPISDLVFHVKRSAVDDKATTLAGIDRGCSLTKAMYLPMNEDEGTETHYAFHCVLFHNDNFTECLHFLKKNAKLPDKGIIRVTGAGCDKYREEIREILGLDVEFVNEYVAIISGLYQFVLAVDDHEELFYPKPQVRPCLFERAAKLQLKIDDGHSDDTDSLFPFIYVHVGSGVGFGLIGEDGSMKKNLGRTMVGGKTLIGLGRSIAGVDDYDELMECAMAGEAGNVDTTIEEIMREDDKSAYGKFPENMPVFPLGKFVDQKRSIDSFDKNDRAASAVRLFACMVFSTISSTALSIGVSRVIFGGYGVRGEALRRQLIECNLFLDGVLNIRFLQTGGTGAFGAMVTPVKPKASQN